MKKLVSLFFVFIIIQIFPLYGQISQTINFSKSELIISTVTGKDDKEYNRIELADLSSNEDVGTPELPIKYLKLLIPSDSEVKDLIVQINSTENIPLQKKIYPKQRNIISEKNKFIEPDANIYESDQPFPKEVVKLINSGYFDGANQIVTIAIYPLRYFPRKNEIDFISSISLDLLISNGTKTIKKAKNRTIEKQKKCDAILQNLIDNPEDIFKYRISHIENFGLGKTTSVPSGNWDYVIITTDALAPAFSRFIEWKTRKGIKVYIKTIDDILNEYQAGDLTSGIDDDAGSVREFLNDSWSNNDLTYALLAGDKDDIPFRYGCGVNDKWDIYPNDDLYHIPADIYFCDINSDWEIDGDEFTGEMDDDTPDYYPEIYVGRLLFQSQEEILNWTEKIIEYERNPFNGTYSNLTKFLWSQADEMQNGNEVEYVRTSSSILSSFPYYIIISNPI